jgi:hypothetical protein
MVTDVLEEVFSHFGSSLLLFSSFFNNRSHATFAIPAMVASTRYKVKGKGAQQHHQQEENDLGTPKKKAAPPKKNASTPRPSFAAKTKNLVKPLKSPDLPSLSAKKASAVCDAGEDDDHSLSRSDNSDSSARPGIAFCVQKQPANAIEASGGINTFKMGNEHALATLCNKAPKICGKRGDSLRETFAKKVCWWSALSEDGLHTDKMLNRFEEKSRVETSTGVKMQGARSPSKPLPRNTCKQHSCSLLLLLAFLLTPCFLVDSHPLLALPFSRHCSEQKLP